MAKLMSAPELDAEQVETVAHAIYRAELLQLFPRHAAASAKPDSPYWRDYWNGQPARTRMSYRQQAIAALKASSLLERVAELERNVAAAKADLECYSSGPEGDRLARRDALDHLKQIKNLPEIGS